MAERETQEIQLFLGRREEEIGLVARRVRGAVQLGAVRPFEPLNVVACRQTVGVQILRGFQQVAELHRLIAAHAGDWGRARQILVGEFLDHRLAEPAFIVENVMWESHLLRHTPCVVNVAPGAAGALFRQRGAMVVELKRDADDVVAFFRQHRGDNGAVDAAGHGDDDPRIGGGFGQAKTVSCGVEHGGLIQRGAPEMKRPASLRGSNVIRA